MKNLLFSLLTILLSPYFSTVDDCSITNLYAEAYDCNEDGLYKIDLVFDALNPSLEGFKVFGNGEEYGVFGYGDPYYTIGPFKGDCELVREIIIVDKEYENCSAVFEFENPICCEHESEEDECQIEEIEVKVSSCDSEEIDFKLSFAVENASNKYVDIYSDQGFFGYYEIADFPLELKGFPRRDKEYQFLKICINDYPDCCQEFEFMLSDCLLDESEELTFDHVNILFDQHTKLLSIDIKRLEQDSESTLIISDITGQLILSKSLNHGVNTIKVQRKGLFLVWIKISERSITRKFISF